MTPGFSDETLSLLGDFATGTIGLRFPPDRWGELARGVASAALELGIPDIEGWVESLLADKATPAHIKALANHLTIAETYFFRNRETFTLLGERVLPERFSQCQQQNRPLRIWSAACSSGEEPYSIAILLRRILPTLAPNSVVIHATDINSHVLARATRGVFSEWSFRDTPPWLKASYFSRKPNGRYEIAAEVKRMVKFSHLNLAESIYPAEFGERGNFDVVLCRNVLMYFSAEWQAKIVHRLVAALRDSGWLIVGPCDISAPQMAELGLSLHSPGVFRKSAEAERLPKPNEIALVPSPVLWPLSEQPAEVSQPIASLSEIAVTPPPPSSAAATETEAPPVVPLSSASGIDEPAPSAAAVTESEIASALAHDKADRGELAAALAACDDAIALDKLNPDFHYLRACILQERDQLAEAAVAFRRVLFLDPNAVMAHFALGCLAERVGDRAEARRQFALVLRLLGGHNRGDTVPGAEGLTVARLRAVVEGSLRAAAA